MIGDTLADLENPVPLPRITVDEPAISVTIGTNSSPLAGPGVRSQTDRPHGQDRLDSELIGNVSLRVLDIGRPTPGRCRAAVSWRWRSSSSRCAAKGSS